MATIGQDSIRLDPALLAYQRNSASLSASEFRLSSGLRVRTIGEDIASVSAAQTLTIRQSTLRSSLQNGAHATTLLQIANNSLSQIRDILASLSELTATANTSGNSPLRYTLLNGQFQQQKAQIDTIVSNSSYNGANLLDGTFTGGGVANFQLGDVASGSIPITIPSVTSASLFPTAPSLGNAAHAMLATTQVGSAQDLINDAIAKVAAYQSRLDSAEAATRASIEGSKNASNALLDTDIPSESVSRTRSLLREQAGATLLAQALGVNANLLSLLH